MPENLQQCNKHFSSGKTLWINVPNGIRPTAAKVPAGRWPPTTPLSTRADLALCALLLHCFCGIWVLWPELWCAEHMQPEPIRLGQQRQCRRVQDRPGRWAGGGSCVRAGRRQTCVFYIWIWSNPRGWLAIEIWLGCPGPFVLIETLLCWSRGGQACSGCSFHVSLWVWGQSFIFFTLPITIVGL